jgi:enterochelin esterase-like enzyme
MKPLPLACHPGAKRSAWLWSWPGLLIILLLGCQTAELQPLPTLVPTAEPLETVTLIDRSVAAAPARTQVPVTFTPAGPTIEPGITTRVVTATPSPSPTAQASSTPLVLSAFYPKPADTPFRSAPPETVPCGEHGLSFRGAVPGGNGEIVYHAYLPPCYGLDGRSYPVLYLIHGSIQTDSHWSDLGLAEYADAGISAGRYPPFIAIMPYSGRLGNMSSGGSNSVEGKIVGDLLPAVDDIYCTWNEAAGRSIGGISRGGYWALEIAFRYPELFGAVSGHSSHLRFETDPARYNPLATYATADLSSTRIWLDRGEKDFLRTGQDQLHERLTEAGIVHEYRVNPGGHSDVYWAEHLPEYLDWHLALWPDDRDVYSPCP